MIKPLLDVGSVGLLKQAAKFAEARQQVLAGNVANINTPGYRMKDLPTQSFREAMKTAIDRRIALNSPKTPDRYQTAGLLPLASPENPTSPGSPVSLDAELFPPSMFQAREVDPQPGLTFQDGNNRSIEHVMVEMTKNALYQNYATEILAGQYNQLAMVISERA